MKAQKALTIISPIVVPNVMKNFTNSQQAELQGLLDIRLFFYYNIKLPELKGKIVKRFLLFFICIVFWPQYANGEEAMRSAQLNMAVPTLTWKGILLKNLPANAVVAVELSANNPLQVLLLNQFNYEKFPAAPSPLFKGDIMDKLSFSVKIPCLRALLSRS